MADLTTVDSLEDRDDVALVCYRCGTTENVSERICAYDLEINDQKNLEIICDACEQEHCDDI